MVTMPWHAHSFGSFSLNSLLFYDKPFETKQPFVREVSNKVDVGKHSAKERDYLL